MAKRKKTKLKWWWIVIPVVAIALFVFYNFPPNTVPQSQQSSTDYLVYQDPTYGFSIEYPLAWEVRKNTQVFENGDVVAFGISGSTQKEKTELTDGAQVVVSQPFSINTDITTWAKKYMNSQAEFSQNSINGRQYEKVSDCSGVGCMTYYFTLMDNKVYGVATFAGGQNADRAVYENAIVKMLHSLQFSTAENGILSKEDAIAKVKALPEVIDYLKRVPNSLVLVNEEEDTEYLVQVYEFKNGHTATFNWYNVNKTTGEVKKEF